LQPLCEGLERGDYSIEEGVEQPARLPTGLYLVLMEWMATITGDHRVGCPGFLGFFSGEKNFGELSSTWRNWLLDHRSHWVGARSIKGGSITVLLTSCLTGLD